MVRDTVWIALLVLLGIVVLWYGVQGCTKLSRYFHYNQRAIASILDWKTLEKGANVYTIGARYSFESGGVLYEGESEVGKPYPNPWAAEKAVESLSQRTWDVWYAKRNPAQSTLKKDFPYRPVISFFLVLALLGYFFFLGRYISSKTESKS